jgi:hypothetical protein
MAVTEVDRRCIIEGVKMQEPTNSSFSSGRYVYELLAGPSLAELRALLDAQDEPQWVNPALVLAWVAREASDPARRIVAYGVLQSVPLAEPVKAPPGHGAALRGVFRRMAGFIRESGARRVLMHSEHPAMKKMLEQAGAAPWPVTFYQYLNPSTTRTKGE